MEIKEFVAINRDLVVSNVSEDRQVLQDRFQQWGYLYFKGYVEHAKCQHLLEHLLGELEPHVAYEGVPVSNGQPFVESDPVWDQVYPRIQALEQFHSFFHQEPLLELMRTVAGEEVFVYPMKMARISTPGKIGYETPPHQDAYSHHAGHSMAGIWVALHPVGPELGRLKVLPGSHRGGVRQVFPADGVGGVQCEIFADETTWHVSDYGPGDVLIFHSCTVHKAEPNTAERAVRVSVDTRFCDYGAPVFSTNLEPHHGWRIEGLDWGALYKDWKQQNYQYYWRDYPNLF